MKTLSQWILEANKAWNKFEKENPKIIERWKYRAPHTNYYNEMQQVWKYDWLVKESFK